MATGKAANCSNHIKQEESGGSGDKSREEFSFDARMP